MTSEFAAQARKRAQAVAHEHGGCKAAGEDALAHLSYADCCLAAATDDAYHRARTDLAADIMTRLRADQRGHAACTVDLAALHVLEALLDMRTSPPTDPGATA